MSISVCTYDEYIEAKRIAVVRAFIVRTYVEVNVYKAILVEEKDRKAANGSGVGDVVVEDEIWAAFALSVKNQTK